MKTQSGIVKHILFQQIIYSITMSG